MSPGKLVDEKDVGCQDKSGPGKIHEVILVLYRSASLVAIVTAPLNVVQIKYVKMTFQTNNINGPANHKDNLELFIF